MPGFLSKAIRNITERITAKKYLGVVDGGLPQSVRNNSSAGYLEANEISLYANRALDKRAEKVGEIEFRLEDGKGNPIENDKLLDLLYRPNQVFTGREFWKLYQLYRDIIGEVYIYVERGSRSFGEPVNVKGLHLLMPWMVTPKFDEATGAATGYEYKTPNETKTYAAEDIIYIHRPDPRKPLRGASLLRAGMGAIETEIDISTYHSRVLKNGGKVEGVFTFKTPSLTATQLGEIKDSYKKEYATAKKAGMPLFLGGEAKYERTGLMPEELAYLEAKKTTLQDICILTGVPQSMLASTSDVKFDNADADRAIFLRETIRPELQTLATALDEKLFPDGRILTFVDPTPENTEEKRKNLETANTIGALTTNEKRRELAKLGMDLEEVDGGDDILVPFSLTPLLSIGETPATDPGQKRKTVGEHPLKDAEMRKLYYAVAMKRLDAREKKFKGTLTKYFKDQEDRIVEQLKPTNLRYFRKANIDDLLNIELEVKLGKSLFIPVITQLLKDAGVDALELAGSDFQFNIGAEIRSWIEDRAGIFLRTINETTLGQLKEQFAESIANEEGREKLINRIEDTYGNINKARAATIARTEVHNATQYGSMEGYKQGGLTTKIWVSVQDGYTRDSHARLDGEERPINMAFSNGLMFPGDPRGSAEEVINCRCVI